MTLSLFFGTAASREKLSVIAENRFDSLSLLLYGDYGSDHSMKEIAREL